ncbi:baeRF12 domain-containing protein [Bradyrhizobium japonicum]
MILPTGTTIAVADGDTVPLFHNTGLEPWGALGRDHGGFGCAPSHRLCRPDGRRLVEDNFATVTAAFPNKFSLDGTTEHLVVVSDARTLGEMRRHFDSDAQS